MGETREVRGCGLPGLRLRHHSLSSIVSNYPIFAILTPQTKTAAYSYQNQAPPPIKYKRTERVILDS